MANGNYTLSINTKLGDRSGLEQLKRELLSLEASLQSSNKNRNLYFWKKDSKELYADVKKLKDILDTSWDSKLNQLDLSKLSTQINRTYGSMENLKQSFTKGGAAGAQAYHKLANEILSTNLHLKESSKLLDDMATSFKNTVKWGISSSIFNSMTGAIQKAWGYTQDLDESLNSIRIVSEKNTEQMAKFAVEANKAAKALGSTTLDYTDASLIYFQQGLSDQEVAARTETTIKMANVLGTHADEVSEYMTAIWNNFDDGSKSLEYYADVITKLGAATASSAEEISAGLEKFAAVSNTIGLSYEYATAALTTVTAKTRQSADVVGTAFKTLFSRIQGLKLGETLDDGTTLNKYSSALQAVGISIKEQNGELKDMDNILDEMGDVWGQLSRDQKVALAQTVAGVRQYNQLMSLMDNWDFFETNLGYANDSLGTLTEQQEIYLDSMEAHLNQFQTEMEKTYDLLFDEEALKKLADAGTFVLERFNDLLTGLGGGLKVLSFAATSVAQIFNKQIAGSMERQIENGERFQKNILGLGFNNLTAQNGVIDFNAEKMQGREPTAQELAFKEILQERMTETQKIYDLEKSIGTEKANQLIQNESEITDLKIQLEQLKEYEDVLDISGIFIPEDNLAVSEITFQNITSQLKADQKELDKAKDNLNEYIETIQNYNKAVKDKTLTEEQKEKFLNFVDKTPMTSDKRKQNIRDKVSKGQELSDANEANLLSKQQKEIEMITERINAAKRAKQLYIQLEEKDIDILEQILQQKQNIQDLEFEQAERQKILQQGVQGISSALSVAVGLAGMFQVLTDEDLEPIERFNALFMTSLTLLPSVVGMIKNFKPAIETVKLGLVSLATSLGVTGTAAELSSLGFRGLAKSILTAQVTVLGFKAALWEIFFIGAIVVAAIAGIVAACSALADAYNADAIAAREMAQYAKVAAEEAAEANEQFQNLADGFKKYNEGIEALKTLDEATEEYKNTLEETNKAALDLIKTDASLAKYAVKGEGGVIKFEKDGKDYTKEAESQAKAKANQANAIADIAKIRANDAQLKSDRTNLLRESNLDVEEKAWKAGIFSALAPVFTPLTVALTDFGATLSDNQLDTVVQTIIDNGGVLNRETLQEISFLNEREIDALMENDTALMELVKSTEELNATNQLLIEQGLRQSLEQNAEFAGLSELQKNAVTSLYGEGLSVEEQEKIKQEAKDKYYKDAAALFGGGNENDVHKEYAAAKGYNLMDDKLGDKAVYYDPTKDEEVTVTDDQAREFLVNKKVTEDLANYNTNSRDTIMKAVQSIDSKNINQQYGADFESAVLNAAASDSKKLNLQSMFADIDPSEYTQLKGMSGEDWKTALGLTDEEFKTLGFGSAQDFADNFKEGLNNYNWDINSAIASSMNKLDEADKEGFKEEDIENMSEYAKSLMSTAEESDKLADSLKYDSDAATLIANQIMRMDRGIDNLADGFEDWNSILKKSSKESQEYADAMGGIKNSLADILDVSEDYISNDFVTKNLDKIKEASTGSETAIESLRDELSNDIIANLLVYNNMESQKDQVMQEMAELQSMIDGMEVGKTIDLSMDDTELINTMNNIIEQAGLTAEQANQLFSQMGIEPEFEVTTETQKTRVPEYTTETEVVERGFFGTPTVTRTHTYQTGVKEVDQVVEVPALGVNGAPIVKKATRKASSSMSNYSSSNKGGKSPGKSKSGGKGSEPSKKDLNKDKKDPYQKVNAQLNDIEKALESIQSQEEKLVGGKLLANLNQQLELLNKRIDKTKEKLSIAVSEQQRLQKELNQYGIQFDSDGNIANYASVYDAQQQALNAIYAKYNSMSADAQKNFEDEVEAAEKRWEEFLKLIEEYDETEGDLIPGLKQEIQDSIDEQIEIQIQKFNMEIEIRLDLEEAQREWNDFKKRIIDGVEEDDILGNVKEDIKNYGIYYDQQGTGIIQKEAEHLYEILDQLKQMDETGTSSYYGDNRAQALEDLKTYTDAIMSSMEELDELIKQIEESYVNLMDEAQEKFDEQIENFEFITENLEHNIQLVELMKGTEQFADVDTFELMNSYYEKQQENYQQQIQFQASQVAFWKEQMDGAEYASDEWESAREKWMAATSELNSLIEASIENLQTKYLNAIDGIFDKMNKSVTDGLGLDYISEEWDLINKNADQYLDTINRAYGIQKLQDKYLDAIDGTDSISAQQKLNKLMEQELNALKNKDKLTEYDLERAEKKYEIALKQIALEEAQQNKSQLRLRRDSQGNYRYEYVTDDDEVSKLKQEIDSLYNALYNFDLDRYKENLEQAYDAWEEMQSKIYDIYQDTTLSEEQRNQKIALLQEQYGELINSIVAENEVIKLNLQESTYIELDRMYGENISHFEEMTLAQQELVNMLAGDSVAAYQAMSQEQQAIIAELCGFTLAEFTALSEEEQRIYLDLIQGYQNLADSEKDILESQIVPHWTSGTQNMINTIAGQGGLLPTCKDAFEQMDKAVEDLSKEMGEVLDDAEKDLGDLTSAQDDTILTTQNMITAMGDLTTAYGNQLAECKKVIDELHNLQKEYRETEKAAKDMAIAANAYRTQEQKKNANETSVNSPSSNTQPAPAPAPAPQHTGPQGNGNPDVGDTVTYTGGYYYTSSSGGSKGKRGIGKQVRITQIANGAKYPIHVYSTDSAYGWLKKEQLSGYDTGGYTGEWDNSGRLALLHQKELVLNATDTQNMLAAVEIIRSITDTIGSGMLSRLASLNASAVGFNANNAETIEQNVHIEANFPNVKDSREIEDALNNLVNTASQRVHTK